MADSRDILGKNRKFTGTDGIRLPTGATGTRVNTTGIIRFNSTTNLAEYYNGTDWKSIDAPPVVSTISVAGRTAGSSAYIDRTGVADSTVETIVINGSLFDTTSCTVAFEGTAGGSGTVSALTTTINSSSQITVTVTSSDFLEADDPYTVKVTNGSGLSGQLSQALDVNVPPSFATAADTNIGTVQNGQTDFSGLTTIASTDADGDTVTHTISSGSLPTGMSLNTNGTFSGTVASQTGSLTEYTFTVQAATDKGNSSRQFKISGIDSLYVTATGGTITTSGDFKIHTFTNDGTFAVSSAGNPAGSTTVEYMVVAGGAGAGSGNAGGGGAGGYRTNWPSPATGGFPISATSYPISTGGGGSGGPSGSNGSNGSGASFSSISSSGGGYGAEGSAPGNSGGSGGGGGYDNKGGGSGNQGGYSPPEGTGGGTGRPGSNSGGGGGGASQAGTNAQSPPTGNGGEGGDGSPNSITGSATFYAGGGSSGTGSTSQSQPGGAGGGGRGGGNPGGHTQTESQPGTANTGGGGGGNNGQFTGGSGGRGIVIIRYKYQN